MPMKRQLNENDKRLFYALEDWQREHVFAPSISDLAVMVGRHPSAGRSATRYQLLKLEEFGLILREPGKARSFCTVPEVAEEYGL